MAVDPFPSPQNSNVNAFNWWRQLNRYQWLVLTVAALGWLFDTMDQQLFVVARTPAMNTLLTDAIATNSASEGMSEDDLAKEQVRLKKERVTAFGTYATTVFMLGWATGGLIFGMFGDRLGRVRTIMITVTIYSLFTGLSALSTGWFDFMFYRFITGLGVGGEFAAGVSLVAEVMPAAVRPYALGLLQALSAVGNTMAAGISLILQPSAIYAGWEGWRWLFVIGVLPALLVVFILRNVKEPDSWKRAKAAADAGNDPVAKQLGDMRQLFINPLLRFHTIIGVLLAMTGVIALWGIGFWTPELIRNNVLRDVPAQDKDYYASIALLLQNMAAFFGIYGFSVIAGSMGRRPAFLISFLLGAASVVLVFGFMTRIDQIYWMVPILGFCTLMVFGGFAIYFPELYPTRLRSTGTSFCYNIARYLAAFFPFILGTLTLQLVDPSRGEGAGLASFTWLSSMGSVDNAFRYAVLFVALIYIVGIITVLFAPETKDKPLPE